MVWDFDKLQRKSCDKHVSHIIKIVTILQQYDHARIKHLASVNIFLTNKTSDMSTGKQLKKQQNNERTYSRNTQNTEQCLIELESATDNFLFNIKF